MKMPRYFDFRVSLIDIEPKVWRRFLLPQTASFEALHEAIQDGFGWEYEHLFEFRDKDGEQTIARADFAAHDVDEEEVPAVGKKKLSSFFTRHGQKCMYVYDFGDNWEHEVEFLGVKELPDRFKRRLMDGARACPMEDCGGVWGYQECARLAGMSEEEIEKKGDSDLAERKEWLGDWKPEAFALKAAKKEFDG
jgi:hypothetical protein